MKIFQSISVFVFSFFIAAGSISAQDLLYKKNAAILNVKITSFYENAVEYKIPGDSTLCTYQISTGALDSVVSSEGKTIWKSIPAAISGVNVKRNYLGIDLFESFVSWVVDFGIGPNNLHLYYERISASGTTSISFEYLIGLKTDPDLYSWNSNWFFWDGWYFSYDPFCYFVKAGLNYYPFNYSLARSDKIRVFTGASLFYGQIWAYDYFNKYPDEELRRSGIGGLIWNIDARYYITNFIQLKGGVDVSVIPFLVFVSPEIGISISF